MKDGIHNAVIQNVSLFIEHGCLTSFVQVLYGDGSAQSFGGMNLYNAGTEKHKSFAGHHISEILRVVGVQKWETLKGQPLRVQLEGGTIKGIGHFINDYWYFLTD